MRIKMYRGSDTNCDNDVSLRFYLSNNCFNCHFIALKVKIVWNRMRKMFFISVRVSKEPGWLEGTIDGKTGLLPENYVEFIDWQPLKTYVWKLKCPSNFIWLRNYISLKSHCYWSNCSNGGMIKLQQWWNLIRLFTADTVSTLNPFCDIF